jgi:hypothetical protein
VSIPGAIDIQNAFEAMEWLQVEGDPAIFAPHLKLSPLAGISPKKILWQFGTGDQTIPNNTESTLVRNAGMQDSLWVYRHDTARQFVPTLPANPHQYLTGYIDFTLNFDIFARPIANASQVQMIRFFQSGDILDPNGLDASLPFFFFSRLFEQPAELPEDLNYLEP